MTKVAVVALQRIRALKKYPVPQTQLAVNKILRELNLSDLTSVTAALELDNTPTSGVSR
jgi:hypothetical protein